MKKIILLILIFSIKTNAQVNADFSVNKSTSCAPFKAEFTDLSINADSWKWDFGNGLTSELQHPTCVYSDPGVYTVTLTARNSSESDTITKAALIQINPSPTTSFTIKYPECGDSFEALFKNTSSGNGLTYTWDFGDETFAYTVDAYHVYNNIPPEKYLVKLYSENVFGCVDSAEKYVNVPFPIARFYEENHTYTGSAPLNLTFKDTSYISDANITSVFWDFGDPGSGSLNTSTENAPNHTFAAPGEYDITYIIFTDNGCSDTIVSEAIIKAHNSLTSFEEITDVSACCHKGLKLKALYPNPSKGEVNYVVQSNQAGTLTLTIMDAQGKLVSREQFEVVEGQNFLKNVIRAEMGKYFITVQMSNGKFYDYDVIMIK